MRGVGWDGGGEGGKEAKTAMMYGRVKGERILIHVDTQLTVSHTHAHSHTHTHTHSHTYT